MKAKERSSERQHGILPHGFQSLDPVGDISLLRAKNGLDNWGHFNVLTLTDCAKVSNEAAIWTALYQ